MLLGINAFLCIVEVERRAAPKKVFLKEKLLILEDIA